MAPPPAFTDPPHDAPVLLAAARWRDRCLRNDGSVFTDRSLWTSENVGYLVRYYAENLDEGEGTFFEKLERQLARAPGSAKHLAAEMFWVMYLILIPRSMHPGTKRRQIRMVWGWSGEALPNAPKQLEEALNEGVLHPGTAYNTHRWREFLFFVRAMESWKNLAEPEREARLADPWVFAKWLLDLDESGNRQLRHILCYLLFPGHFEPVATNYQKRLIVKAFRKRQGKDPDQVDYEDRIAVDRELRMVRERHVRDGAPRRFSFYEEQQRSVWQPDSPRPPVGIKPPTSGDDGDNWYKKRFGEARVWALAPGAGARHWDEFRRARIIAIGWDEVGDLKKYPTRESIHEKLREAYNATNPSNNSLACYQFAHEMSPGDHVIVKQGRALLLGHGVVESDYEFDDSRSESKHTRRVRWERVGRWSLPKERWLGTKTLTDSSGDPEWLRMAFELMDDKPPPVGPNGRKKESAAPYTDELALEDLFMDAPQFHDIVDTLARKMNIVLEGPPGVGKTFIAKRLAYRLIGFKVPERVRMIQFHQSYAYEDFIQGFRPRDEGGFELRNGVFYKFCREAAGNPDKRYVFIIDEVNRGNLSKIFGELMMLIEADKRSSEYAVPLTYSPDGDPFHVPDNLFLIGMMNTADRSLAMVDYALRRRFAFVRLTPAFGTDQFSDFLLKTGVEEDLVNRIVDRLSDLNGKIREDRKNLGPGFEIGHSFFCPRDEDELLDESWYRTVVRREIEPLLREYWFDRPEYVDERVRDLLA